jgi:energy-coupling factor transport system permease protein
MELNIYGEDSRAWIKLDPRVKLLIFLSCGFVSFGCTDPVMLIMHTAFLCAMVFLCGKRWVGLIGLAVYLFCMLLRWQVMSSPAGAPVVLAIVNGILLLATFGFPMILSLILLVQTTKTNQLLCALEKMHLPAAIIIPLAVLFRFIPTVIDEWQGIRQAMAFRGISLEPAALLRHPVKTIEYILIPLLFSCVQVIEEMASATLARGLDSEKKRTSYENVQFGLVDLFITAVLMAVTFYALAAGKG